jgi:nucleoside-diphosphate-sugar epimerase
MRAIVTGAAGFIGSHLCDRLLKDGHEVTGIDSFSEFYPRPLKEQNLAAARQSGAFRLHEMDLAADELGAAVDGADVVFHLAGRCGLGRRAGDDFNRHIRDNVLATQRILDALVDRPIRRFVYVGSSSIYGDAERLPTKESSIPRPLSSYGVTKLAAENLAYQYASQFGMPATVLRLFTIYGPRQRPDMAIARFMSSLLEGHEIQVFGDGEQTRDLTFVSDAVEAIIRSAATDVAGRVVNIGGGSRATMNAVLATLENISGLTANRRHLAAEPGDQRHSSASINRARQHLGWEPRVSLGSGLAQQWAWFRGKRWDQGFAREVAV